MENKIHRVRKPFYCREGQFTEGKQDLVVGIAKSSLEYFQNKGNKCFYIRVGESDTIHIGNIRTILRLGHSWINKKDQTVIIIPLYIFTEMK